MESARGLLSGEV